MDYSVKVKGYWLKVKEGGCRQRLGGRVARCLLVAALLFGGMTARAANYVIMANSGGTWHFYAYNSTQDANYYYASDVTTFTYSTCVWSGSSGSSFRNSNNTSYGLYYRSNNYLRNRNNYDNFTISGNKIYSSSYYVCYNNGWYTAQTNNTYYTNGISDVLYSISGPQAATWTTPVSISGSQSTFTNLGAFTYSASAAYRPAYYTLTGNGTYYVVEGGTPTATLSDLTAVTYTWTLNDGTNDDGHVRINASTGEVTYYDSYASNTNTTIKVTATHTASGATSTNTKTITFNALPVADPTGITATDKRIGQGDVWTADNYTFVVADGYSPYRYVTAESANTSIATVNNTSGTFTVTGVEMGSTTITITAYKQGNSVVAATTTFTLTVAEPQSGVSGGKVILNDYEDHSWSYYSDPDCPIRSLNPADVKITYHGNGTGTISTTNGTTPANNSWTQNATTVQVSYNEADSVFIYYKTLERLDGSTSDNPTGLCAYTTIPNPFSVRPTYTYASGTNNNYCGFYMWRIKNIKNGKIYDANDSQKTAWTSGNVTTANMLYAEGTYYFQPDDEYGMEVELEAMWARAYVTTGSGSMTTYTDSYERNFHVVTSTGQTASNYQKSYPVTISSRYPNGSSGGGSFNAGNFTAAADTKVEYLNIGTSNSNIWTSAGNSLILGRGITGTVNYVRGMEGASSSALDYTIRLESGTYTNFYLVRINPSSTAQVVYSGNVSAKAVLGSDYDRAKADNGKLSIAPSSGNIYGGAAMQISASTNRNNITFDWTVKSGTFHDGILGNASGGDESIYLGSSQAGSGGNLQYIGKRRIVVEGGNMAGIAGAMNNVSTNYGVNDGTWAVMMRIKNGTIRSSVYGAAAFAQAVGDRVMIITGGTINGWVAGGCNGTTTGSGGTLNGDTKIYVGGNSQVVNTNADPQIGTSTGGNIFGAGSGYSADYEIGEVNNSNIVVADNATISKNVFGGGNYGYVGSGYASNIYIAGGTVKGNVFGGANQRFGQTVNVTVKGGNVKGGVYGGSNVNGTINNNVTMNISGGLIEQGAYGGGYGTNSNSCNVTGTVDITMTGGTVLSGLYGGGNVNSTINNNVTMQVNGGQVGTPSSNANIHGGGYGTATAVSGNVSITLGASTSATDSAIVNGNVFGGSALGRTNTGNTSNTTLVTMNKALVNGNVFGGALGNGAVVNGKITVTVNGGRVNGNIFGGGDAASYSPNSNHPIVNMTGGKTTNVFGGGKGSTAAVTGNPQVTLSGTAHVTGNVYGGGDAAAVSGQTNVILRD